MVPFWYATRLSFLFFGSDDRRRVCDRLEDAGPDAAEFRRDAGDVLIDERLQLLRQHAVRVEQAQYEVLAVRFESSINEKLLSTHGSKRVVEEPRQREARWHPHWAVLRLAAVRLGGCHGDALILFERKREAIVEPDDEAEVPEAIVPGARDCLMELAARDRVKEPTIYASDGLADNVHGGDAVPAVGLNQLSNCFLARVPPREELVR